MNLLLILVASLVIFWLGARWYGRGVYRLLKVDESAPTPAITKEDGLDYVPTKVHVVFAHHFATIAGAGPIIGPTVAALYGFLPAWLWIVFGGILFGAAHDLTALVVSVKEGGRTIADITRKTLGRGGFLLFISFALIMLVVVTSAFLNATAMALTSRWPLERLDLGPTQTAIATAVNSATGVTEGIIGGIASTSVIIMTLFAPILGWLIFRRRLKTGIAYIIAFIVAALSVILGFMYPVSLEPRTWMWIISIYCLLAAGMPVWIILQPRDFTNVQLLYGGMLMILIGVVAAGLNGTEMAFPAMSVTEGTARLGFIWPMMFITVACGAISGFHSLVSSGTSSKQIERQRHARTVGFGAMLLESSLAVLVLLALSAGLKYADYLALVHPAEGGGNPILAFALAVGRLMQAGTGLPVFIGCIIGILMVEGFIITSLDTAIRYIRYLLEELWAGIFTTVPGPLKNPWVNSGIGVVAMALMAAGNTFNALWPIFGAVNQLLAALTLITLSVWLTLHGLKSWYTVYPAIFMTATTVASLLYLLFTRYLPQRNWTLTTAALVLLALAGSLASVALARALELYRAREVEPAV